MTKQEQLHKQPKQKPKFKVGDIWRPYPIEHWSLQEGQTKDYCNGTEFKQGLTPEMVKTIKTQKPIKITSVRYGDDYIVAADDGGFSWDMHSLAEKLTQETHPEYFL